MVFAPSGWGKSRLLGRRICYQDLMRGTGQVVIDRVGGTIDNLLDKVLYLPKDKQIEVGRRLIYCNMAGSIEGMICPFPMLYKWHESERVEHTSDRVVKLLSRIDKKFDNAAIYGLKRAEPLLRPVCDVLIVNSCPIYFAEDILVDPARFMPLITRALENPESREGALSLIKHARLPAKEREVRSEPLRNRLSVLRLDSVSRGMFSTTTHSPLIDWEKVVTEGQTVLIDLSGKDLESAVVMKHFWVWNSVLEFIESRGARGHSLPPLGVIIDELSTFVAEEALNREKIIADFRKIVLERKRNANIYLCAATQEQRELPYALLTACMSLGSLMFGATVDRQTALRLSERFETIDPYKLKDKRTIMGFRPEGASPDPYAPRTYGITGEQKTFFSFDEQKQMNSDKYMNIPKDDWYMAQALYEGHVPRHLTRITTRNLDPGQFVNKEPVMELKRRLMIRDGIRLTDAIQEMQNGREEIPDASSHEGENTDERQLLRPRRTGRRRFVEQ